MDDHQHDQEMMTTETFFDSSAMSVSAIPVPDHSDLTQDPEAFLRPLLVDGMPFAKVHSLEDEQHVFHAHYHPADFVEVPSAEAGLQCPTFCPELPVDSVPQSFKYEAHSPQLVCSRDLSSIPSPPENPPAFVFDESTPATDPVRLGPVSVHNQDIEFDSVPSLPSLTSPSTSSGQDDQDDEDDEGERALPFASPMTDEEFSLTEELLFRATRDPLGHPRPRAYRLWLALPSSSRHPGLSALPCPRHPRHAGSSPRFVFDAQPLSITIRSKQTPHSVLFLFFLLVREEREKNDGESASHPSFTFLFSQLVFRLAIRTFFFFFFDVSVGCGAGCR